MGDYFQSDRYYQSVVIANQLIPYTIMRDHEKKLYELHSSQRADEIIVSRKWKWYDSLSKNAKQRMNKWEKLCS